MKVEVATTVHVQVGGLRRHIDPHAPLAGDWELTEALGLALAEKLPARAEVLLASEGSVQALLHVLGRQSGLPTVLAAPAMRAYMAAPLLCGSAPDATTRYHLGAADAAKLKGKRVTIVVTVASAGCSSIASLRSLLAAAGAHEGGVVAAFVEGECSPDVVALGRLPPRDVSNLSSSVSGCNTEHCPTAPTHYAVKTVDERLSLGTLSRLSDLNTDAEAPRKPPPKPAAEADGAAKGSPQRRGSPLTSKVLPRRRSSLACCGECGMPMLPKEREKLEGVDSSRYCTCDGF